MRRLLFAILLAATPSLAASPAQPPEPARRNWNAEMTAAEALRQLSLEEYDPTTDVVVWTGGFTWGFMKPGLSQRIFGWVACGTISVKKRSGGYGRAKSFYVFVRPEGQASIGLQAAMFTTCDKGPLAPVDPMLANVGR